MVERNLGFVYWLLGKFLAAHHGARVHREDLEQAGMVGLVEACIRYDPARGQLTTYAEHYVVNRMQRELESLVQLVPAPRLGAGGHLGRAPAMAKEPEGQLLELADGGLGVDDAVDARHLCVRAVEGTVRHLGKHVPDARRDAEIFFAHLLGERTDAAAAAEHKVTRERVGVLRARAEGAFQRWRAEESQREPSQ